MFSALNTAVTPFPFGPFLLELGLFKPALSLIPVGFIHGSQLSVWFLIGNLFIIKCFEIDLTTVLEKGKVFQIL